MQRPAGARIEVALGHGRHGLDVPDVLGDQHDDDRHDQADRVEARSAAAVKVGQAEPGGVGEPLHRGVVEPAERRSPDASPRPRRARSRAGRGSRAAARHSIDRDQRDGRDPGLGAVVGLGDPDQVEADQRDDGPGDDRRQQQVEPAGCRTACTSSPMPASTRPVTSTPPSASGSSAGSGEPPGERDRLDRRDERERRAEVARHPTRVISRKSSVPRPENSSVVDDREAGEHRHQEGRAEHRQHVLRADAEGRAATTAALRAARPRRGRRCARRHGPSRPCIADLRERPPARGASRPASVATCAPSSSTTRSSATS